MYKYGLYDLKNIHFDRSHAIVNTTFSVWYEFFILCINKRTGAPCARALRVYYKQYGIFNIAQALTKFALPFDIYIWELVVSKA